jgi:hypothetical protein
MESVEKKKQAQTDLRWYDDWSVKFATWIQLFFVAFECNLGRLFDLDRQHNRNESLMSVCKSLENPRCKNAELTLNFGKKRIFLNFFSQCDIRKTFCENP